MKTYQVTLPDALAAFADRMVAEKHWDSVDDLLGYALGYVEAEMREDEFVDKEALRKAVQLGVDQLDRGEYAPLDMAAVFERMKRRLTEEKEMARGAGDANHAG